MDTREHSSLNFEKNISKPDHFSLLTLIESGREKPHTTDNTGIKRSVPVLSFAALNLPSTVPERFPA